VAVAARSGPSGSSDSRHDHLLGRTRHGFACRVTNQLGVAKAIAMVQAKLGTVTLLVNNAGVGGPIGPTWEVSATEWWRTMEVNLRGALLCVHAVLPAMVTHHNGRIVNIVSNAGVYRWPNGSGYAVSETAVIKFTKNLAVELRNEGVTLFAVHPGIVRTGLTELALDSILSGGRPRSRVPLGFHLVDKDKILDIDHDLISFYRRLRRAGWKSIIPANCQKPLPNQ